MAHRNKKVKYPWQEQYPIPVATLNPEQLSTRIQRTLPNGVELLRVLRYRVPLTKESFEFLILRVVVPERKEESLLDWKCEFEDTHQIRVFFDRWGHNSAIRREVKLWAKGATLLTAKHLQSVQRTVHSFYGKEPKIPTEPNIQGGIIDRTDLHMIAIDSSTVNDREDCVWAEENNGEVILYVAIIDVTWFVSPGNDFDRYAERVGETVYGSTLTVPTLGREAAATIASFRENETRPAWLATITVALDGAIKSQNIERALIKTHAHIEPRNLESIVLRGNGFAGGVKALALAASRLRAIRVKAKQIIRVEGEGLGEVVVAESMIAIKKAVAKVLIEKNIPAIFRVHSPPPKELIERFTDKVVALGIPAKKEDFEKPLELAGILQALEERQSWSLMHRILRAMLVASSFSDLNSGHYGIGISAAEGEGYVDIKPRDAAGIANQFQLRASTDPTYEPLPMQEVAYRAEHRDRQRRRGAYARYRLRFAERVAERLAYVGKIFEAVVQRRKGDRFLVSVDGFSKWGIAKTLLSPPPEGASVKVKLLGFSVRYMRFRFKWIG